jgi:FkbM family methyltransferase
MSLLRTLYRNVVTRPSFRRFNSLLFHLSLHGLGVMNYENGRISGEQHLVRRWLPKQLKKRAPVFVDVGANVGKYSALLLESFPTAVIHAFEPHPRNYAHLLDKSFPADRVRCHNIALGEAPGFLSLYDRADHDGSPHASLHEAVISEIHQQRIVNFGVPIDTLDAVATAEAITFIDFLKIDTEGHELAVLGGASRLLREGRIGFIQFEFNEMNVVSRAFFRDFRKALPDYEFYRLLPKGMVALGNSPLETELFAFQNILAVPKVREQSSLKE